MPEASRSEVNATLDRAVFKGLDYRNEASIELVFEQQGKTFILEFYAEDRIENIPDLQMFLRERK